MAISQISQINNLSLSGLNSSSKVSETSDNAVSFGNIFNNAINNLNDIIQDSNKVTNDFAAGKTDNIHDVTISMEKADVALQFTMQIRNKILDAYNEIMRMQI